MRHSNVPISYQTLQVLSDLRSVAAKGFSDVAARIKPEQKQALRTVIFDQRCKLKARDTEALHADLLLVAALPDKDFSAFLAATALLLADRLQDGAGGDDLHWNWDSFQDRFREAPASARAALMNGFRWAHATRRTTLKEPPNAADLYTYDQDSLLELLKRIAREMDEDTIDEVSLLAENDTAGVHRRALENCLKGSCVVSEFGDWFPGEVVDKASRDSNHPGFSHCLALVLIDALFTKDAAGRMALRWEEQAEDFNLVPPQHRTALIAGVRHLHEMAIDWQPYADWPAAEIIEKAIVVPFAKA